MNSSTGKYIIIGGIIIIAIGILIYFFHDKLKWVGNLPGDIKVVRENFQFYFPITTMIIFSIIATMLIWLIRKL